MAGKIKSEKSSFEENLKRFIEQLENEKQALSKILRSVKNVHKNEK